MPGVRRIGSVPEEKYRLAVNLSDEPLNFVPAHVKTSSARRCGERWKRRPAIMAAGGVGLEPFEVRINTGLLSTLFLIILVIWLIYSTKKV
jgi:hypothetical protein